MAMFVRSQYREIPWVMLYFFSMIPIVGPWARKSFTDSFRDKRGKARLHRYTGANGDFKGIQKIVFVLQKQLEPSGGTRMLA
jgi:hypothetical protein